MGTNHPDYEKHFEEVVDRRDKERLAKLNKKVWAKKNKQKSVKGSVGPRAVQQG